MRVEVRKNGRSIALVREGSLAIGAGEIVCLVGESGSGKSVLARTIMGLTQRDRAMSVSGSLRYDGQELIGMPENRFRALRGTEMSMIFQEPMSSLDPVYTVESQLRESLVRAGAKVEGGMRPHMERLLADVGIRDGDRVLRSYPFQLSGGMCQRVMIAMGLAGKPRLLIADEPTTALDVTIQAQILDLVEHVRRERDMSMLLVTHDMGVAARLADRIAVMYAGRVVEYGTPPEIFDSGQHPYTRGLLACIPSLAGERRTILPTIGGAVPHPSQLPSGCAFHPRCPMATAKCAELDPPLAPVAGRDTACWHPGQERHLQDWSTS
ncbi:ABC transporter ATP-binding protein [Ornithinimicrobium pratense]|uniref:ABC transporter ATP-binding protein n=1 Tax=Ornithinimicrobium pratense TaxID=2593973 RepID=UPI0017885B96|nr:ABC transporter ATP-binding protein [Ornithinimicrobium pratense]